MRPDALEISSHARGKDAQPGAERSGEALLVGTILNEGILLTWCCMDEASILLRGAVADHALSPSVIQFSSFHVFRVFCLRPCPLRSHCGSLTAEHQSSLITDY